MDTLQHECVQDTRTYKRTWGLRFSLMDAVTICVILGAAALLWRLDSPLAWMLLITAGHFFLFCNVFRIIPQGRPTYTSRVISGFRSFRQDSDDLNGARTR